MATDRTQPNEIFSGGCRCGSVKYTSSAPPSEITLCYCRACQQVSGSGYLPFLEVPTCSFKLVSAANLETIELSTIAKRTFCRECGTPITMVYSSESDRTHITVGSINKESYKVEKTNVNRHMFVEEKATWTRIPEDGIVRFETWPEAHPIARPLPAKL